MLDHTPARITAKGRARSGRRALRAAGAALILGLAAFEAAAKLDIRSYYSPRNGDRPKRADTRYIVLHTTEGPTAGSLKKLHERGEAHYFVDPEGRVYRIIHRKRVALHAGRSMWDGKTNIDDVSIGIEVVGYHDREITGAQAAALRELLDELQRLYDIPDERVLTHSMVAYGAPNRWHRRSHRGRKRCGMLFARRSVRERLGLDGKPSFDPDVRAGRLVVGDPYLAQVLYSDDRAEQDLAAARYAARDGMVISEKRSAWDIARDQYNAPETLYIFPDGREQFGNRIEDWKKMPAGTRVVLTETPRENSGERVFEIGGEGGAARDIAGDEYNSARTIYLLPDGRVRTGAELDAKELERLPEGTRVLVGYTQGGYITAKRSAFDVCGVKWNDPSTFYRMASGAILPGDRLKERAIPQGTMVFFRN